MEKLGEFTRKRALTIVFFATLIIFLMVLGRWLIAYRNDAVLFSTTEGRQMFLSGLGWETAPESEEVKNITLPEKMDAVLEEYNKLQLTQGYDLKPYLGKDCVQYTYLLTNYDAGGEDVYICIYVAKNRVIAGDIHSNSMTGFMQGIRKPLGM